MKKLPAKMKSRLGEIISMQDTSPYMNAQINSNTPGLMGKFCGPSTDNPAARR